MKVRLAPRQTKPQRGGFTLIELLVVISIIAMLASLILPGVQGAREAARRVTCFNNMRNVGLAVTGYVTANNGAFPPLSGGGDCWQLNEDSTAFDFGPAPWTVALLPYLEQAGLYDRLTEPRPSSITDDDDWLAQVRDWRNINIKVFTCPNDLTSDEPGAFSFAANAGYIGSDRWVAAGADVTHRIDHYTWALPDDPDPISNTERLKRVLATGVFWREDSGVTRNATPTVTINSTGMKMTLDRMRDGTSQTLMLTENLSNGGWLPAFQTAGRGSATGDIAFGLKIAGEVESGVFVPTRTLNVYGAQDLKLADNDTDPADSEKESRINNNLTANSGSAPRPSSLHPQIVNVIFCDGHGQTLNQSISDSVYARLLTPNGNLYGHAILSGNDF